MLQHPLPCTHNLLQNVNYRKKPLRASPLCLPTALLQQFGLPRHMCALILPMLLLQAASPQAYSIPSQRRLVRPTHSFAARALQGQLPFHPQASTVISLLSIPCWISQRAGGCGDSEEEQAPSGALCSLWGVLALQAQLSQVCSRLSKT